MINEIILHSSIKRKLCSRKHIKLVPKLKIQVRLKWMPSINFYKRTRTILKKVQLSSEWKLDK